MQLFEVEQMLGGLPKKAGLARLKWDHGIDVPARKKEVITLPIADEVQYFPLASGAQFLIKSRGGEVHFGGTDEQPFLVEMKPDVVSSLNRGEAGFYNTIKPSGAKMLEGYFGTTTLRQGDWFAVPLPFSWQQAMGMVSLFVAELKIQSTRQRFQLGGTRHHLTEGRYVHISTSDPDYDENESGIHRCEIIGEGILVAPDHKNRVLEGPHAFFQTERLQSPREAD